MEIVVKEEGMRLDKYIALHTEYSRARVASLIAEGLLSVNKEVKPAKYLVKEGDVVSVPEARNPISHIEAEDIPVSILYEDEDIIVVDKPTGMSVHPGAGNTAHTLVNALKWHTDKLSSTNGSIRPGIVHRIDKDTSGVLVVAKSDEAHRILAEGFKNKTIKREYVALLDGVFPHASATIDAPIGRDPKNRLAFKVTDEGAKEAVTHLKVLKRFKMHTLVSLRLETGRTHQIRVHMKYIGYPVHNDPVYNTRPADSFGQFLHAKSLEFAHPITHEKMYFESPLPKEFQDYLDKLE